MSSLMVRPSSRITSCTCSAISGGREKVIVLVFLFMSLLVRCCLTLYHRPSDGCFRRASQTCSLLPDPEVQTETSRLSNGVHFKLDTLVLMNTG